MSEGYKNATTKTRFGTWNTCIAYSGLGKEEKTPKIRQSVAISDSPLILILLFIPTWINFILILHFKESLTQITEHAERTITNSWRRWLTLEWSDFTGNAQILVIRSSQSNQFANHFSIVLSSEINQLYRFGRELFVTTSPFSIHRQL